MESRKEFLSKEKYKKKRAYMSMYGHVIKPFVFGLKGAFLT